MEGLILGLDLCDAYTQMICSQGEKSWTLPTVICRKRDEDLWLVGEPAYASALKGDGVIVDKLMKLACKDGTSTIGGIKYGGMQLLVQFLVQVLALAKEEYKTDRVQKLVITVQEVDPKLLECLKACGDYLGIAPAGIHVISHTESFIYYVLSQKREVWNNQVGMFDLSEDGLCYYEMKVQRGMRQNTVVAERERQEESFDLGILDSSSGAKLADKILCSCGSRLLQKKLFSSVFLTGEGFLNRDWAEQFMKFVCTRRKVYMEDVLFAKGAMYQAEDLLQEKSSYPFVCICEGRLDCSVAMKVMSKSQEGLLSLAKAGQAWYESDTETEVILDNQDYLEFMVMPLDSKKNKVFKLVLEGFPKRGDKTLRVLIQIRFLDQRTMSVTVTDQGFGEFFPSTGSVIRQEVML